MECVCIGNGESRKGINLGLIPCFTIGCNALYRDYSPDLLISCDKRMEYEIKDSGYNGDYLYRNYDYEFFYKGRKIKDNKLMTGSTALEIALALDFSTIYLLGYDLVNGNIYKGTDNYNFNGVLNNIDVMSEQVFNIVLKNKSKFIWVEPVIELSEVEAISKNDFIKRLNL